MNKHGRGGDEQIWVAVAGCLMAMTREIQGWGLWRKGSIHKRSRRRVIDHHLQLVALSLGNLQLKKIKWKNRGSVFDLVLQCSLSLKDICIK